MQVAAGPPPVIFVEQKQQSRVSIKRSDLNAGVKRLVIKVGTNVVTQEGQPSLTRLANLVEQVATLKKRGKEVVLVSSGSVCLGRKVLEEMGTQNPDVRTCAAIGQARLMHIYQFLFGQQGIKCSQLLVTDDDFRNKERRHNLRNTIDSLLIAGIVPVLNENDVTSQASQPLLGINDSPKRDFLCLWDNDSLACLIGLATSSNLIVLLSDVDGVYKSLPTLGNNPDVIATWMPHTQVSFGAKSNGGRGGMQAKIDAILRALHGDHNEDQHKSMIDAVVIANGMRSDSVLRIINGEEIGTLFVRWNVDDYRVNALSNNNTSATAKIDYKRVAQGAREGSRELQKLSLTVRRDILHEIANRLQREEKYIIEENKRDIEIAGKNNTNQQLVSRLKLNGTKIASLVDGIKSIADSPTDPLGRLIRKTELSDGLILEQVTAPIGVLLVIFESRPEVLPQVSALSIMSGNGLILKGGKEAIHSNKILHKIIIQSIQHVTKNTVQSDVIGLVESREGIQELLEHDEDIDLVIPRGSASLVSHIQKSTKIPVMGHSEGICHIYVHQDAKNILSIPIIIDSKTDYPSACNAAETLLINRNLINDGRAQEIINALRNAKVKLYAGPIAIKIWPDMPASKGFKEEYGDLGMTVEVVEDIDEAIRHINKYGSSHTDTIITHNPESAAQFLNQVDSACVFYNASTRFADGYRFGLGAEVGISTGRIHARGPVGIDGLLTSKWRLRSSIGHIVSDFSNGKRVYTHKNIPISPASKL